ncbi:MAG TPA: helical backbone metal receptor [Selenomonadales bacterium]|nr:helical backbone metal receptor [Selenomonadales bacterium]
MKAHYGQTGAPGLKECRCLKCNRLLFKGQVKYVEIQCSKCNLIQTIKKGRSLRLVALNPSNVDLYYAAGGELVGRPDTTALPPDLMEKIKDVPSVGETPNPNVDQIIALKPDLVLAADIHLPPPIRTALKKAGIPLHIQSLNNYQQIGQALRFYGELTNHRRQVGLVIDRLESKMQQAQFQSKNKPSPRTLAIWSSVEGFHMALPNSFTGDLIRRLNAVNVAETAGDPAGQYAPFHLEFALQADPDLILLIPHSYEDRTVDKIRQELMAHPDWRKLKAVRENQVYQLPYRLFAVNPGSRADEAIDCLLNIFYPG